MNKIRNALKSNLADILKSHSVHNQNSVSITALTKPGNVKCMAVLRTKGGSGEKHLVKKLIDELINDDHKIILCFKNAIESDDYYLTQFLPEGVSKLINLNEIGETIKSSTINLDWRFNDNLAKLFKTLGNLPANYTVIFTTGTGSAGELYDWTIKLSSLCETVFLSVNSDVENSVMPAKRLCKLDNIDKDKLRVCWWHNKDKSKPQHLLGVFKPNIFSTASTEQLNKMLVQQEISLLDFCNLC